MGTGTAVPHVIQLPFLFDDRYAGPMHAPHMDLLTYVGLDHLLGELLLHHRGCELVVYAFDHRAAGSVAILSYKLTGALLHDDARS